MLSNMKLKSRLGIGFGVPLFLLLTIGGFALYEMHVLSTHTSMLYMHPFAVSNTALRIDSNIVRIHRSMKDVALAKNSAEVKAAAQVVDDLEQKISQDFRIIAKRFLGNKSMYQNAERLFRDWKPIREEVIALMLAGKRAKAADITKGKGAKHAAEVLQAISALSDFAQNKAATFFSSTQDTTRQAFLFMIIMILLAIGIGTLFTIFITRSIVGPAKEIAGVAEAISRGELNRRITYQARDEIGQMADSLRRLLTGIIGEGQSIKNGIPLKFWTTDTTLTTKFINSVAAKDARALTGLETEEIISRKMHVGEVMKDEDGTTSRLAASCLNSGERYESETCCMLDDGPHFFQVAISPLRDLDGGIVGIMGVEVETTQRKQAEEKLRQTMEMAEAANRTKSEFLANMSHELRTPLNGIMGMLQIIESSSLSWEQQNNVESALGASHNLLIVINDILDISRIEAGKFEIIEEEFVLPEILHTVTELLQQEVAKKQINIHYSVSNTLSPVLVGDPGRIRQIFFNLIGNAVKFTKQGEININVSHTPLEDGLDRVQLACSVSDTGIGIPQDKLLHIFEPFTQVSSGSSKKFQGTGLGLSITKRLVEAMGGEISVQSEEDKGSTFYFYIKVGMSTASVVDYLPEGDQLQTDPAPPALRILVVEDNELNLKVMHKFLKRQGHATVETTTGEKALKALKENRFDCILMDIQLPEMDGMEATRLIRNGESGMNHPDIPIIAVTAHTMVGDQEKFLEAGMDDYLAKPIRMAELKKVLAVVTIKSDQHK